jgi:hypothetical protein
MSKQTAVEWLEEQDNVLTMKLLEKKLTPREFVVQKSKLVEQAKQMEKEQIVDAKNDMLYPIIVGGIQYYNETYGGQDETL